jgi:quercetin dioxygenase-like cupin family protein
VGLTHLKVYTAVSIDGIVGGSPHVHLASAEAYIPTAGSGEAQTLSAAGFQTHRLEPGVVVWFEPGVIHRLVNSSGDLEILAIMQNAGLPEAGDAVFTFPGDVMSDAERYLQAATLPTADTETRMQAALRRRDLAIRGFNELLGTDDSAALDRFFHRAIAQRAHLFAEWSDLLRNGVEAELQLTRQRLDAIAADSTSLLHTARLATTGKEEIDHQGVGMCGMLQQYAPLPE